jgi:hypothetical protein
MSVDTAMQNVSRPCRICCEPCMVSAENGCPSCKHGAGVLCDTGEIFTLLPLHISDSSAMQNSYNWFLTLLQCELSVALQAHVALQARARRDMHDLLKKVTSMKTF